jgi:hypothetical protein
VWKLLFVASLDSVVYWYILLLFFITVIKWFVGHLKNDDIMCIQRYTESMNKKTEHNFIHHTIKYFELSLQADACLPSISVFNQNNTATCSKTAARTPAVLWTVLPLCQDTFIWLQLLSCELSGSHLDISWSTLARYSDVNRICGNKCKVPPTLYTNAGQEITVTTAAQKQHCVHIPIFKPNIPARSTSFKISMSL